MRLARVPFYCSIGVSRLQLIFHARERGG
jgi:hypothetical protein